MSTAMSPPSAANDSAAESRTVPPCTVRRGYGGPEMPSGPDAARPRSSPGRAIAFQSGASPVAAALGTAAYTGGRGLNFAGSPGGILQRTAAVPAGDSQREEKPPRPNQTGMPDALKAGMETLAGMDLSGVRVHRNSPEPARVHALAYAHGSHIHLAPGQEQHLPHEAWHVVQQRQGRVQPTMRVAGAAVNDDPALEREADSVGTWATANARQIPRAGPAGLAPAGSAPVNAAQAAVGTAVFQMVWTWDMKKGKWFSDLGDAETTARPTFKGKENGEKFPPPAASSSSGPGGLAGEAKLEKIQPYLDLLPHLAGEWADEKAGTVKGGHLLADMTKEWGDSLQIVGEPDQDAVWECEWRVNGGPLKASTMFPASWDNARLHAELMGSTTIGSAVTLKSGFRIKKAGDTFYPVMDK